MVLSVRLVLPDRLELPDRLDSERRHLLALLDLPVRPDLVRRDRLVLLDHRQLRSEPLDQLEDSDLLLANWSADLVLVVQGP